MRNPQEFTTLLSVSQDPFYDELKRRILAANTLPALCEELQRAREFREEEIPNLRLWIPVLNKLDAALESILQLHGDDLLLPLVDERGSLVIPPLTSSVDTTTSTSSGGGIALDSPVSQLKAILRWTIKLLKNSIKRVEYSSVEHIHACLRAYDDEVAGLALELLATAVIQQYNHRNVTMIPMYKLHINDGVKANFADLYDIISAAQCKDVLRPGEIVKQIKSGPLSVPSSSSKSHLELSFPPRKLYLIIDKLNKSKRSKEADKGMLWTAQGLDDNSALESDKAVVALRETLASIDLNTDTRSLREFMQLINGTLTSLTPDVPLQTGLRDNLAEINSYMFMFMWRARFLRRQARVNIWAAQLQVLQAIHIIASSHDNVATVCQYFWAKGSGKYMADIGAVFKNLDMAACCDPLHPAESLVVPYDIAFWGCMTVASLMTQNEELMPMDDEDSQQDMPKRRVLLPPFEALLQELGLDQHQIAGCIPTLLKKEVDHYLSVEVAEAREVVQGGNGSSPSSTSTSEQRRVSLFENLLLAVFGAINLHGVPTTLVDNGIIALLLPMVAVPQSLSFVVTNRKDVPGGPNSSDSSSSSSVDEKEVAVLKRVALQRRLDSCKSLRVCISSFTSQILDRIICKKAPRDLYNANSGQTVHFNRLVYEAKLLQYIPADVPMESPISLDNIHLPDNARFFDKSQATLEALVTGPQLSEKSLLLSLLSMTTSHCNDSRNSDVNDLVRCPRFVETMKAVFKHGCPYSSALLTTAIGLIESLISFDPAPPGVLTSFIDVGLVHATWEAITSVRVNLDDDTLTSIFDFIQAICVVQSGLSLAQSFNCFRFLFSELQNPNRLLTESITASGDMGPKICALLRYYPALATQCMNELMESLHQRSKTPREIGFCRSCVRDLDPLGDKIYRDTELEQVLVVKTLLYCLEQILETTSLSALDAFLNSRVDGVLHPIPILFEVVKHTIGPSDDFFLQDVAALRDQSLTRGFSSVEAADKAGVDAIITSFHGVLRKISSLRPSNVFDYITSVVIPQLMMQTQSESIRSFSSWLKEETNAPRFMLSTISDSPADLAVSKGNEVSHFYKKSDLKADAPDAKTLQHMYVSFLQRNAFMTTVLVALSELLDEITPSSYFGVHLSGLFVFTPPKDSNGVKDMSIVKLVDFFVSPATNGFRLIVEQIFLARLDRLKRAETSRSGEDQNGHYRYRLLVTADRVPVRISFHKTAKRISFLESDAVIYAVNAVQCRESEGAVWFQLEEGGWVRRRSKSDSYAQVGDENVHVLSMNWIPGPVTTSDAVAASATLSPLEVLWNHRSPRQAGIVVMDLLLQSVYRLIRSTLHIVHTRLLKRDMMNNLVITMKHHENLVPNLVSTVSSLLMLSNVSSLIHGKTPSSMDPVNFTAAHVSVLNHAIQLSYTTLFSHMADPHGPRELIEVVFVNFLAAASPFDPSGKEPLLAGLLQATAIFIDISMPFECNSGDSDASNIAAWDLRRTVAIDGLDAVVSLWRNLLEESPTLFRKRDASFYTTCQHGYDLDALWGDSIRSVLRHVTPAWQHPQICTLPPHLLSSILEMQSDIFARSSEIFKALVSKERLRLGRVILEGEFPDAPWLEFLVVKSERDVGNIFCKVLEEDGIVLPAKASVLARIQSIRSQMEEMPMVEDTLSEYEKECEAIDVEAKSAELNAEDKSEEETLKHEYTLFVKALPTAIQREVLQNAEKDYLVRLPQKYVDVAREMGNPNALSIPKTISSRSKLKRHMPSSDLPAKSSQSAVADPKKVQSYKVLPYPLKAAPSSLETRIEDHSTRMWSILASIRRSILSLCRNWQTIPLLKNPDSPDSSPIPAVWSVHTYLDAKDFREAKLSSRVGNLNLLLEKILSGQLLPLLESASSIGDTTSGEDKLDMIVITWIFDVLSKDLADLRCYYADIAAQHPQGGVDRTNEMASNTHGYLVSLVLLINGQRVDRPKRHDTYFDVLGDLLRTHEFFSQPIEDLLWLLQTRFSSESVSASGLDLSANGNDAWVVPGTLLLDALTRTFVWTPEHTDVMMQLSSCLHLSDTLLRKFGDTTTSANTDDSFKAYFRQVLAASPSGPDAMIDSAILNKVRENYQLAPNVYNGNIRHDGGVGRMFKSMPLNKVGMQLQVCLSGVNAAINSHKARPTYASQCSELLQGVLQSVLHIIASSVDLLDGETKSSLAAMSVDVVPNLLDSLFGVPQAIALASIHYPGMAANIVSILQAVGRLTQNREHVQVLSDGRSDISSPLAVEVLQLYRGAIQHARNLKEKPSYSGETSTIQVIAESMKNVYASVPATCLRVVNSIEGRTALLSRTPRVTEGAPTIGRNEAVLKAKAIEVEKIYASTRLTLQRKIEEAFAVALKSQSGGLESLDKFNNSDKDLAALLVITADIAYSMAANLPTTIPKSTSAKYVKDRLQFKPKFPTQFDMISLSFSDSVAADEFLAAFTFGGASIIEFIFTSGILDLGAPFKHNLHVHKRSRVSKTSRSHEAALYLLSSTMCISYGSCAEVMRWLAADLTRSAALMPSERLRSSFRIFRVLKSIIPPHHNSWIVNRNAMDESMIGRAMIDAGLVAKLFSHLSALLVDLSGNITSTAQDSGLFKSIHFTLQTVMVICSPKQHFVSFPEAEGYQQAFLAAMKSFKAADPAVWNEESALPALELQRFLDQLTSAYGDRSPSLDQYLSPQRIVSAFAPVTSAVDNPSAPEAPQPTPAAPVTPSSWTNLIGGILQLGGLARPTRTTPQPPQSPPAQTMPPPSTPEEVVWSCSACTFDNLPGQVDYNTKSCSVCGTPRKTDEGKNDDAESVSALSDLMYSTALSTPPHPEGDDEEASWATTDSQDEKDSAPGIDETDEGEGESWGTLHSEDDDDDEEDEDKEARPKTSIPPMDDDDSLGDVRDHHRDRSSDADDDDESDDDEDDDEEEEEEEDGGHYHRHRNHRQRTRGRRQRVEEPEDDNTETDMSDESGSPDDDDDDDDDNDDDDEEEGSEMFEEENSDDEESDGESSMWVISEEDEESIADVEEDALAEHFVPKEDIGLIRHKQSFWDHPLMRRARLPEVEGYELKRGLEKEASRLKLMGSHYAARYWGNDVLVSSRGASHLMTPQALANILEIVMKKTIDEDEHTVDATSGERVRDSKWVCTACDSGEILCKDSNIACPNCFESRYRAPAPASSSASDVKFIDLLDDDVLGASILLKDAKESKSIAVWSRRLQASQDKPQLSQALPCLSVRGLSILTLVLHLISQPAPLRHHSRAALILLHRTNNLGSKISGLPQRSYTYDGAALDDSTASLLPAALEEQQGYANYIVASKQLVALLVCMLERDGKSVVRICLDCGSAEEAGDALARLDDATRNCLASVEQAINTLPQNSQLLLEIVNLLFKHMRFISCRSEEHTTPEESAFDLQCVDWDSIMGHEHVHLFPRFVAFASSEQEGRFLADGNKISADLPSLFGRMLYSVFHGWKASLVEPISVSAVVRYIWRICKTRVDIEYRLLQEDGWENKALTDSCRLTVPFEAFSAMCDIHTRSDCCRENLYKRMRKIVDFVAVPPFQKDNAEHPCFGNDNWEQVVRVVQGTASHLLNEVRHVVLPRAVSLLEENLQLLVDHSGEPIPSLIFSAPNAELRLLNVLRIVSGVLNRLNDASKVTTNETDSHGRCAIIARGESPREEPALFVKACLESIKTDSIWPELTVFLEKLREFEEKSVGGDEMSRSGSKSLLSSPGSAAAVAASGGAPSPSNAAASGAIKQGPIPSSLTATTSGFHFFPLVECFFFAVSAEIQVSSATGSVVPGTPMPSAWSPTRSLIRVTSAEERQAAFRSGMSPWPAVIGRGLGLMPPPPLGTAMSGEALSTLPATPAGGDTKSSLGPPLSPSVETRRGAEAPLHRELSLPGSRFRENDAYRAMQLRFEDPQLLSTLIAFVEQNKTLLNAKLRHRIRLLETSMKPMVYVPECRRVLDFTIKRKFINLKLDRLRDDAVEDDRSQDDIILLTVDRSSVLEQSFECFRSHSASDLQRCDMEITFSGEEGIDAGGLTREWYMIITREIFRPSYGLFVQSSDGITFQPNEKSELAVGGGHLSYFKFVGQVIGKAICDDVLLDVHFTRAMYKHMLGVPVSYDDLEAFDLDYFKSLKLILSNSLDDLGLELTFSAESGGLGEVALIDLILNGRNIEVTDDNKAEYVRLIAHHRMTASCRRQIDSFLEGFHELVPSELISILDAQELELLISGLPEIDIDDMEVHTSYSGYTRQDPIIKQFWSILRRFSREEKALFVQFVTGSSKVPLDGFAALQGSEGTQMMSIHKAYDTNLLPTAHTCFNQLDLPQYATEEVMREKLMLSLHEGSEGFGFQ